VRAACLDLALASLPDPRATFALGMDRPLYLSVHSAAARLAPEGGALVHAARYLDPSEPEDAERDRGEIERVLDLVQPGWREQVVHKRFLPHLVVTHGLVTAARGATAGRPGPEVPGTRGLYVAGDWVGPEGQLADASLASARRAAESCVRDVPALAVAA
jgi:phytoene dehydrogenase-like protein